MNGKITRLGIVVLSMFALAIGTNVCYSVADTAEDCYRLEASASTAGDLLAGCDQFNDCDLRQEGFDYWDCRVNRCWNTVDQVCSDTGCACMPAA